MRVYRLLSFLIFSVALAEAEQGYDSNNTDNSLDCFLSNVNKRIENMDKNDEDRSQLQTAFDDAQSIYHKIKLEKNKGDARDKELVIKLTKELKEAEKKIQKILDDIAERNQSHQTEQVVIQSPLVEIGDGRDLPGSITKRISDKNKRKIGDEDSGTDE